MSGTLELLTKMASQGMATLEKLTEVGMKEMASAMEGTAQAAESCSKAVGGADKPMAYLMDKAMPGMGQQNGQEHAKGKGEDNVGLGI